MPAVAISGLILDGSRSETTHHRNKSGLIAKTRRGIWIALFRSSEIWQKQPPPGVAEGEHP